MEHAWHELITILKDAGRRLFPADRRAQPAECTQAVKQRRQARIDDSTARAQIQYDLDSAVRFTRATKQCNYFRIEMRKERAQLIE